MWKGRQFIYCFTISTVVCGTMTHYTQKSVCMSPSSMCDRCRRLLPPLRKMFSSLFVCLFVSSFAQNFGTDLHDIFTEGWEWANEQIIKFWWRSGSGIQIGLRIRIRFATLVRRILTEVCTVPVLLVVDELVRLSVRYIRHIVAAWRSGNIVGRFNEVTLRRAQLVLGWVTVFGE